jgi:hydrogenase expression/formation protein HypE
MMEDKTILLSHGSGGKMMHDLIGNLFRKNFSNEILNRLGDSAVLKQFSNPQNEICFTTDSYVVHPLFFPGGDIGKLAICGTINDLAVMGAKPLYLSCGFIIEEGLEYSVLEKIVENMGTESRNCNVLIVTGDIKVVEKNKADKVFINTSGIGIKERQLKLGVELIEPGDCVLINGTIGDHGAGVLVSRGEFALDTPIKSDCASLASLISEILQKSQGISTTLNEIVMGRSFGIQVREESIPIRDEVRAACEILGFDPLILANEGKVVIIAHKNNAGKILEIMNSHPLGKGGSIIGEVVEQPAGKVVMKTSIGGHRILDMPVGEQLPRIC